MDERILCECCEEEIIGDAIEIAGRGGYFCDTCIDLMLDAEEIVACEECGDYVDVDDAVYIENDNTYVCEDCAENNDNYFQCARCGSWYRVSYNGWNYAARFETSDGIICDRCFDTCNYTECFGCGEYFSEDDIIYCEEDDVWRCNACYENEERSRKKIRQYSYKPQNLKFKADPHDQFFGAFDAASDLTFGVELEIDKGVDPEECASEMADASEDIYFKHDGSLVDNGIEIVTMPCTLNYHLNGLGWDKVVNTALDYEYKSHDANTCGLHVHVGRNQLGGDYEEITDTIKNILILMARYGGAFKTFSRRSQERLNEWAKLPVAGNCHDVDELLEKERNGRYHALNLTNSDTIEFRLFRGSLVLNTIYATLQFVSNVVKYAKSHTMEQCETCDWLDFADYESYPELTRYLNEKGLKNVPKANRTFAKEEAQVFPPDETPEGNNEVAKAMVDVYRNSRVQFRPVNDSLDPPPPQVHEVICIPRQDPGMVWGVIVHIVNYSDGGCDLGCVFPYLQYGHDLGGTIKHKHGWYIHIQGDDTDFPMARFPDPRHLDVDHLDADEITIPF